MIKVPIVRVTDGFQPTKVDQISNLIFTWDKVYFSNSCLTITNFICATSSYFDIISLIEVVQDSLDLISMNEVKYQMKRLLMGNYIIMSLLASFPFLFLRFVLLLCLPLAHKVLEYFMCLIILIDSHFIIL